MSIRDNIEMLEQQIYVACSEDDYETVRQLEDQLEMLRTRVDFLHEGDRLDDNWVNFEDTSK
ncbi:hypothetical protein [Vibrio maerlii]|uniref:hypothetical protein n=1 Tax=Vibrio maerlii TaxID=2231648 RepID=UPI000E3E5F08|nr:hypothetical protein [Vibrio maerlii]